MNVTTSVASETAVVVKIVLRGPDGSVLASDHIGTRLQKSQPNGPNCQPICFRANVHLTPAGKLAAGVA